MVASFSVSASASASRLLLLGCGRAVGCFRLPESSRAPRFGSEEEDDDDTAGVDCILVLSSSGGCLTYSSVADGVCERCLTRFAPSHLQSFVRTLLAFRNSLVAVPYVCERFSSCDVDLGYRISTVRWPSVAASRGPLHSLEGAAVLALGASGRTFYVQVLSPLSPRAGDFRYTTLRQTFFVDDAPACYAAALRAAAGPHDGPSPLLPYAGMSVPATPLGASEPHWPDRPAVEEVVVALCADPMRACFPAPHDIAVEWTPRATYRRCSASGVVQATTASACFVERAPSGFFTVDHDVVYAPRGVPRNHLRHVTDHANRLAAEPAKAKDEVVADGDDVERPALAVGQLYVVHQRHVPGLGEFARMSDNSVRVIFADRMVLSSDAKFRTCTLISPADASVHTLSVPRPKLCKNPYVAVAARFFFHRHQ